MLDFLQVHWFDLIFEWILISSSALAFYIVFRANNTIDFILVSASLIGAYIYTQINGKIADVSALSIALILGGGVSALLFNFLYLLKLKGIYNSNFSFIVGFCLMLLVQGVIGLLFGYSQVSGNFFFSNEHIVIGTLKISSQRIAILSAVATIVFTCVLILEHTIWGLRIKACGTNFQLAETMYSPRIYIGIAYFLGGVLTTIYIVSRSIDKHIQPDSVFPYLITGLFVFLCVARFNAWCVLVASFIWILIRIYGVLTIDPILGRVLELTVCCAFIVLSNKIRYFKIFKRPE